MSSFRLNKKNKEIDKSKKEEFSNKTGNKKLNSKVLFIFLPLLILIIVVISLLVFKKPTYIINFDTNGGSIVTAIKTNNDAELILPEKEPDKKDYIFNGWKLDNKYIFGNTLLHNNIELKADWIDDGYDYVQVIFAPGTGFDNLVVYVEKNQRLLEPINPEKKNNTFKGWYLNNSEFDFNSRIESDLVLIGRWDDSSLIYSENEEYYCFDNSFELKDGKCNKEIIGKIGKEYYCEENWELTKNNQCMMLDTSGESLEATPQYTCENGYSLNGNKCSKSDVVVPSKKYNCNQGIIEGDKCYSSTTETPMYFNGCSYSDQNYVNQQKEKVLIYCINNGGTFQAMGCTYSCLKNVKKYVGEASVSYSCPNGYNLNNGICTGTKIINATVKEYTCEDGYINSGSKCYNEKTSIKMEEAKNKIICKDGFELKADKCIMNYTLDAIKNK